MARTLGPVGALLSGLGAAALLIRRRFTAALLLLAGFVAAVFLTLEPSLDFWSDDAGTYRNLTMLSRAPLAHGRAL